MSIIYPELLLAQKIFSTHGLVCDSIINEAESKEYSACTFRLNNQIVLFRAAKVTPTKVGQFVTIWKRLYNGPILPYDMADPVDLFIIFARSGDNFGQFIFPKNVLFQKGFISKAGIGGKRAMRVYPPWDSPDNQQARKSQAWQELYFVEMTPVVNINKLKELTLR